MGNHIVERSTSRQNNMDQLSISTILSPIVGEASKHIINYLKGSSWFGFLNKTDPKGKKHLFVLGIVTVLSLIVAFLTGSLNDDTVNNVIMLVINIAFGHGSAVTSHELATE